MIRPTGDPGFHGDEPCIECMSLLLDKCHTFIETGSFHGATVGQVALNYPNMECYSCEPNDSHYDVTVRMTKKFKNAFISKELSVPFMQKLIRDGVLKRSPILFYLDAHGYGFQWDLRKEVEIATKQCPGGFVVIDDFQVPGNSWFGFDRYDGQVCNYNYVKDFIRSEHRLYYPKYTNNTTTLKSPRGWCIIAFGTQSKFELGAMSHVVKIA